MDQFAHSGRARFIERAIMMYLVNGYISKAYVWTVKGSYTVRLKKCNLTEPDGRG